MTSTLKATRRTVLAGTAAAASIPALGVLPALAGASASATPVARLWAQAEALKGQLAGHAAPIAAMEARTGLAGWMRLGGAANDIGNRRYDTLVAILKETPKSIDDLAILARVTREDDIRNGPATWSRGQFDRAAREYHLAA